MLNSVNLIGRLTRDPELRYTPNGAAVANCGLAVNRQYKDKEGNQQDEVCFVDLSLWGKTAENIAQYQRKGSLICVQGHLKLNEWTDQEGQKRQKIEVVGDRVDFLERKGQE